MTLLLISWLFAAPPDAPTPGAVPPTPVLPAPTTLTLSLLLIDPVTGVLVPAEGEKGVYDMGWCATGQVVLAVRSPTRDVLKLQVQQLNAPNTPSIVIADDAFTLLNNGSYVFYQPISVTPGVFDFQLYSVRNPSHLMTLKAFSECGE